MKKIIIILSGFALLFSSCKSFKKTTGNHTQNMRLNKLLHEVNKHRFSGRTLEARMAVSYNDNRQNFSGSGKIRILKDSIIWGSMNFLGIPMVKFYITPKKIQYYNKVDQTYYDGNFDLLTQKFGLSFSFSNLQNMLTGDLITKIDNKGDLVVKRDSYELLPKDPFIKKLVLTSFFKMLSGTYYESSQGDILLQYNNYKKNNGQDIPGTFIIKTGDKIMQIDYKSVVIDKDLRFPFKVPANYKKIEL